MHHIKNWFVEKYLCWLLYREPYVPYETMLEKIVGSTSTFSNIYEVIDDNHNRYKSMVMEAMRINHGYSGEGSCVHEKPNVDATRFF